VLVVQVVAISHKIVLCRVQALYPCRSLVDTVDVLCRLSGIVLSEHLCKVLLKGSFEVKLSVKVSQREQVEFRYSRGIWVWGEDYTADRREG
jgi:hypothetical protein